MESLNVFIMKYDREQAYPLPKGKNVQESMMQKHENTISFQRFGKKYLVCAKYFTYPCKF